jgi:hypothetical protein
VALVVCTWCAWAVAPRAMPSMTWLSWATAALVSCAERLVSWAPEATFCTAMVTAEDGIDAQVAFTAFEGRGRRAN